MTQNTFAHGYPLPDEPSMALSLVACAIALALLLYSYKQSRK